MAPLVLSLFPGIGLLDIGLTVAKAVKRALQAQERVPAETDRYLREGT